MERLKRLGFGKIEELVNRFERESKGFAFIEESFRELRKLAGMKQFQSARQGRLAPFMPPGPWMDNDAAANRASRGFVPHDEVIATQHEKRLGKYDLTISRLLGLDGRRSPKHNDFAKPLRGAEMDAHALMTLDPFAGCRPDFQERVKAICRQRELLVTNHLPALDGCALRAGEI